jgi:hypothetical protein
MSTLLPAVSPNNGVSAPLPSLGHLPAKRNRTQLSCTHCRQAKLKCDRKLPCSPCVKKGRSGQCSFPPPATRKKPAESMQSRLRHLENLVKDVMNAQVPIHNDSSFDGALVNSMQNDSVVDFKSDMGVQDPILNQNVISNVELPVAKTNASTSGSSGQLIQNAKETTYVGATHWAAILDDVSLPCSGQPTLFYL